MNEENNVPKKTSPWVVLVVIVVIAGAITGYLLLKPGTEGGRTGGEPEILEYTDTKYDYAFQYPSYWEVQKSTRRSQERWGPTGCSWQKRRFSPAK
jgi:hypothetical protein